MREALCPKIRRRLENFEYSYPSQKLVTTYMQYVAVSFGELNFAPKLFADKVHGLEAAIFGLIDVLHLARPLPAQGRGLHRHWDYGGEIDVQDGQVIFFNGVLKL